MEADRLVRWTEANFTKLVELVGESMGFLDVWSADPDSMRFAVSRAQRLITQRVIADDDVYKMNIEPRIATLLEDCRAQALLTLADHMEEVFANVQPGKPNARQRSPRKIKKNNSLIPVRPPSKPPSKLKSD